MTFKIKLIDIKIDNTFCLKLNYSITQANCQSAEEACLWLASLRYKKKSRNLHVNKNQKEIFILHVDSLSGGQSDRKIKNYKRL